MDIVEIIIKKKDKKELTKEELSFAVDGYISGTIADYQMSSLLMAICIHGMSENEIFALTDIMLNSGNAIDLSFVPGIKVDKHSTGGIGDKTTLALIPLVASLGINVAKMSGRGLGYTGGTIDKLESIENFKTSLTTEEFKKQIEQIGVAIASQTGNLVPADKKLYALRDVTGTTESIPLIASSIMSKKLAGGADKLIIDVKVGKGALMKTIDDARFLASIMVKIGKKYGKETVCLLSNMDQPLGFAVGNGLEVKEALDFLKGKEIPDFKELVLELGKHMVCMSLQIDPNEALEKLEENLQNKKAYAKFLEFVKAQGGIIHHITLSKHKRTIKSQVEGFIKEIDAEKIGKYVHRLGAGRTVKTDPIHYGVGVYLHKKVGDFVLRGEDLVTIYYDHYVNEKDLLEAFLIGIEKTNPSQTIYEIIQ